MKVRIGALELDVTMDELDELVQRYAGLCVQPTGEGGDETKPPSQKNGANSGPPGSRNDVVILKKFVEAGPIGIPTNDLGEMLGRRGKATRGAARDWAIRMKIISDKGQDPFEECRVGTLRGLRIKSSLMDIAKAHLNQ